MINKRSRPFYTKDDLPESRYPRAIWDILVNHYGKFPNYLMYVPYSPNSDGLNKVWTAYFPDSNFDVIIHEYGSTITFTESQTTGMNSKILYTFQIQEFYETVKRVRKGELCLRSSAK